MFKCGKEYSIHIVFIETRNILHNLHSKCNRYLKSVALKQFDYGEIGKEEERQIEAKGKRERANETAYTIKEGSEFISQIE